MKSKFLLLFLLINVSTSIAGENKVAKEFITMKACLNWLDSNFKNKEWHKEGYAWDLYEDLPESVIGVTYKKNLKGKIAPVSISCVLVRTGTKGIYYLGTIEVIERK